MCPWGEYVTYMSTVETWAHTLTFELKKITSSNIQVVTSGKTITRKNITSYLTTQVQYDKALLKKIYSQFK